jgi:hypothetical protein
MSFLAQGRAEMLKRDTSTACQSVLSMTEAAIVSHEQAVLAAVADADALEDAKEDLRVYRQLRHNVQDLLWVVSGKASSTPAPASELLTNSAKEVRVMLSYNWANQTVILRLREALKEEGFDVWIDVEQV